MSRPEVISQLKKEPQKEKVIAPVGRAAESEAALEVPTFQALFSMHCPDLPRPIFLSSESVFRDTSGPLDSVKNRCGSLDRIEEFSLRPACPGGSQSYLALHR